MDICIVGGAGYVGLITGLGLAKIGHHVTNVDINQATVKSLQSGKAPFYEVGIEDLLRESLDSGRIRFTTDLREGVVASGIVFIAVGTPSREDGQADLSQVIQSAEELAPCMDDYKIIVIKSTVPVGTVELIQSIMRREKQEGRDFDIVSNPEFLREGNGLRDFFYPDRIVIGASSEKAKAAMRSLYEPVISGNVKWPESDTTSPASGPIPVVETDLASAQMIKYASNAFLATRISFINQISGLSSKLGADISEVTRGMGYDPRIGHAYLGSGLGFGGPCLEKDLRGLISLAEANGYEPQVLKAVWEQNERQIGEAINKLKELVGYLLYRKIVAAFGLSFKAETNDVRNSQPIKLIDRLEKEGALIRAHDPMAIPDARALKPDLVYCEDPYEAVRDAEALMILTQWPSFKDLDYSEIKKRMAQPNIVDPWSLLNGNKLRSLGFNYEGSVRLYS